MERKTKRTFVSSCQDYDAEDNMDQCDSCKKWDNADMVQCDSCDKWWHFRCAGVGREVKDKEWSCLRCIGDLFQIFHSISKIVWQTFINVLAFAIDTVALFDFCSVFKIFSQVNLNCENFLLFSLNISLSIYLYQHDKPRILSFARN